MKDVHNDPDNINTFGDFVLPDWVHEAITYAEERGVPSIMIVRALTDTENIGEFVRLLILLGGWADSDDVPHFGRRGAK